MAEQKPTLDYAAPDGRPPEPLWFHVVVYLGVTSVGALLIWGLFAGLSALVR